MNTLHIIKAADIFSLANAITGCTAIFLAIKGQINLAALAIILAGVFDFLDGKIARITKSTNAFGRELDSLADMISFGVAPVILGFLLMPFRWYCLLGIGLYLLSGILRVANFNITNNDRIYIGMPITLNIFIFPTAIFLKIPESYFFLIFIFSAIMMLLPFRFRSPIFLD